MRLQKPLEALHDIRRAVVTRAGYPTRQIADRYVHSGMQINFGRALGFGPSVGQADNLSTQRSPSRISREDAWAGPNQWLQDRADQLGGQDQGCPLFWRGGNRASPPPPEAGQEPG